MMGSPFAARPLPSTTVHGRPVWVVFARKKYDEPLYEVGTVTAEDPEMAALYARSIYDEQPWIEMIVAPRSTIKTVIVA